MTAAHSGASAAGLEALLGVLGWSSPKLLPASGDERRSCAEPGVGGMPVDAYSVSSGGPESFLHVRQTPLLLDTFADRPAGCA